MKFSNVQRIENFKREILKYFEPENRELKAGKALSALKQMGAFTSITACNAEFFKWLLQVPTMASDDQIFYYSQGLKNRIRVEIEKTELT